MIVQIDLESYIKRFEDKYMTEPNTGCWLWLGVANKKGYGFMSIYGKNKQATHISLFIYKNILVSKGLDACHKCDNPICVNPDHLFVGTRKQNMLDCEKKGRSNNEAKVKKGEKNGRAKLSDSIVKKIIKELNDGRKCAYLSNKYKISHGSIWFIQKGVTWKHIKRT